MANKTSTIVPEWTNWGIPYPAVAGSESPAEEAYVRGVGALAYARWLVHTELRRGHRVFVRARHGEDAAAFKFTAATEPLASAPVASVRESARPVFGPYDFAATVGHWLRVGNRPAAALLSPFISTDGFEFTPAEFVDLKDRLERTLRRYARLPRVSKSLEDLNTGFFRHRSLEESRGFISEHLEDYLARADRLHRDYLLAVNGHARRLLFSRQRNLLERRGALVALHEELDGIAAEAGRRQKRRLKDFTARWSAYREQWYGEPEATNAQTPLPALRETLRAEAKAISQAHAGLNRELQPETLALSHVTVANDETFAGRLRELADALENLVREIDEAGLYQLPIGGAAAATAPRQLQRLEGLLDRLRNTHRHLHELDDFYARRHFWYAQPARLRRLLAPLLDLPAEDWETAFTSWYFERCLQRTEHPAACQLDPDALAGELEHTASGGVATETDQLKLLPADAPLPSSTAATDFCVDLTGAERPKDWPADRFVSLRPLWDASARPYQLAGVLHPGLIFGQSFLPVRPPDWASVPVSEPPPGSHGRLSLQAGEDGEWRPLGDASPKMNGPLRLYLPREFSPDEGQELLRVVPELLLAGSGLRVFHAWPADAITQALLSDGLSAGFLAAVLIRVAEAAATEPYDREALLALGREFRTRCGLRDPAPHPLARSIEPLLSERLPDHFFELHQPWRDTFLPLVALAPDGRKTVLLPDGRLPGYAERHAEALRQRELRAAGFSCLAVRADALWIAPEEELRRIARDLVARPRVRREV